MPLFSFDPSKTVTITADGTAAPAYAVFRMQTKATLLDPDFNFR